MRDLPPLDPPAASVPDLIGRTSRAEIRRFNPNPRVRILAKLAGFNPTGSIKMIGQAEREVFHFSGTQLLLIALSGVVGPACVDTTVPSAVANCADTSTCTNDSTRDAAAAADGHRATDDLRPYDSPDVLAPPPSDAAAPDRAIGLAEAGFDSLTTEPAREPGVEAQAVVEPEPQRVPDAGRGPEPGPEAGSRPESGPGPEAGPGVDFGLEVGPGPGPESGPEPGAEPPRDGAVVGSCPAGGICDDFEDGDYSANPTWTVPANFAVASDGSKVLSYTGSATPAIATIGKAATALTIQARVKITVFGGTSNSYRLGVFARVNSQTAPSVWYGLTITGDGSLRLQATDSTPSGCGAVAGAAAANTWYILTLTVSGTVSATTLQGTLTDETGGNARSIGPCSVSNGLAAGWPGVGVRGAGTQGEFDDVKITGITP